MSDRTYTITLTLTVSDADGDGVWVVASEHSDDYGAGDTPYLAVADYLESMGDSMKFAANHVSAGQPWQDIYDRFNAWVEGQHDHD